MQNVATVGQIVAPVFFLAAVGFGWTRAGLDYPTAFVTRLAMTLAVPSLIFVALMEAQVEPRALTTLTAASLVAYGAALAAAWGAARLLGLDRRAYVAPLAFGNTGNIGLPLALFAFGPEGLSLAVVVFAVMAVLTFTLGVWLVAGTSRPLAVLREPVVLATLAGATCLWFDLTTPAFVTETLRLAGQMAIPLMLVTLGVAVARLRPAGLTRPVALSAAKLALCTGVGWAAGRAFGLSDVAFAVLVIQLATPVAVTSYLLAEKYDADPAAVAGLVVVSTLLSIGALPLLLGILL